MTFGRKIGEGSHKGPKGSQVKKSHFKSLPPKYEFCLLKGVHPLHLFEDKLFKNFRNPIKKFFCGLSLTSLSPIILFMICVHKAQKIEFQKIKYPKFGLFLIFFYFFWIFVFFGTTQGARTKCARAQKRKNYFYDVKTTSHKT